MIHSTPSDSPGAAPIGVGPWPGGPDAWAAALATDDRLDPELLEHGDTRNVIDRYRYWRLEAIIADLDTTRHALHVGIENFAHDMNIGSVVRTANAFNVGQVHIIGKRRWNRRGAMVTEKYQHVSHHESIDELVAWCDTEELPIIGIDNVPGSVALETYDLPERCLMLFGQEGPGLSVEALRSCEAVLSIAQYGSTRSINAGAAAAIAMHAWIRRHPFGQLPDMTD